jgi:hypothetical protein
MAHSALQTGTVVKAIGLLAAPRRLTATSLEPGPSSLDLNTIELSGAVSSSEISIDDTIRMAILGVAVIVPQPTAHQSRAISRRLDDKRPEDQKTVNLFGRPLTIGGEVEVVLRSKKDFELDPSEKDDVARLDFETELELFYQLSDKNAAFFETKASAEKEVHREDDRDLRSDEELERGEMWLYLGKLFDSDFSLQLGRQDFEEFREWWWDEDLDAIRLYYDGGPWQWELGIAEELTRVSTDEDRLDPEQEDVRRLLGRATWRFAEKHRLEFFLLDQRDLSFTHQEGQVIDRRDEDESDADLTWFGARAIGRWNVHRAGNVYYWLDTAVVRGDEILIDFDDAGSGLRIADETEKHDVRGWGLDLGVTWQTRLSWRPSFSLGYAIGSGDSNPDDDTDRNFRQTGLQDNNGRFRGVNRFRYYGELLRPELSNLHILTASFGFPIWKDSSVEIAYHRYRQDRAADFLRDGEIDADPLGIDKDIGEELDIVVGLENWKHVELEFVAAVFRAGDAFGSLSGETATNVILKFNYNF